MKRLTYYTAIRSRTNSIMHIPSRVLLILIIFSTFSRSADALLIVHTSLFGGPTVSEEFLVSPTAPEDGTIFITNLDTTSLIADIDYISNLDQIFIDDDGGLTDVDTLVLRGTNPDTADTSGMETFVVDLDAAGTITSPQVTVEDTSDGDELYRVRSIDGYSSVSIQMLANDDIATVFPSTGVALHIDGGPDFDTLDIMAGGIGFMLTLSGNGSGTILFEDREPITFINFEELQVDGNSVSIGLPEPSTFMLASLGLISLGFLAWRRRR